MQTAEPLEEGGRELGQGVLVEVPVPAFHPDRQIASQSVAEMQESRTPRDHETQVGRQEGRQAVASGRVSERVIGGCEDDEDGHISRVEERSPLPPSLPPHGQVCQTAEPLEEVGRELGQGVVVEPPVPAFHPDRQIASQSQRCKRVAHREIMGHRGAGGQEGRQWRVGE